MSPWSLLIFSAGIMAAEAPYDGPAKGDSVSTAPYASARVESGITQLDFSTSSAELHISQTSYSNACAAPVTCCAPAACTPVSCAAAASYGCGQSYGTGPYVCHDGCPCSCGEQSCCDRCKNRCAWRRAHTTGDMYPHYAYFPEHHGYYYFRPYNWMHVLEHQARIVGMGGDSRNPYSVAMFDVIYQDFEQRFPRIIDPPAGSIRPLGSHLPNLEDLLNNGG